MKNSKLWAVVLLWLVCAVAFGMLLLPQAFGANWIRDDAGLPSAQCAFVGTSGNPTLCSATDPLPTANVGGPVAPTTSSTDPVGWGLTWQQSIHTAPGFGSTFALTAPNENNIFAYGASGGGVATWVSTNGGKNFAQQYTSAALGLANQINAALLLTSGDTLVGANAAQAVPGQCGVVRSDNGGAFTTSALGAYPAGIACHALSFAQQGATVLAAVIDAANNLRLCRSTDTGVTWTCPAVGAGGAPSLFSTGDHQALASPATNTWLVVGQSGGTMRVFRSTNNGTNWADVLNMGAAAGGNVVCLSSTICLASNRAATIFRSTDAGATWVGIVTLPVAGWGAGGYVNFGGGVVVAIPSVAGNRQVFRSSDSGASWQQTALLNANEQVGTFDSGVAVNGLGLFSSAAFGTTPLVMYSPIVKQGQTQIVGANGFTMTVDSSGAGLVAQGTPAANVNNGWPVRVLHPHMQANARTCVTPAANTAAVITIPGVANNFVWWYAFVAFYDVAPAVPQVLTAVDGANTVWRDVVAGILTPTTRTFGQPLMTTTSGGNFVVTLPAGGVGVSGSLCITAHQRAL